MPFAVLDGSFGVIASMLGGRSRFTARLCKRYVDEQDKAEYRSNQTAALLCKIVRVI
jgi:hypothetical protein